MNIQTGKKNVNNKNKNFKLSNGQIIKNEKQMYLLNLYSISVNITIGFKQYIHSHISTSRCEGHVAGVTFVG